jgi:metal-responsive CopG/Arc/MetJ family transcriptional regulator
MKNSSYERVNISLPGKTLKRIDRVAKQGDRSRLIDAAVNFYLTTQSAKKLRKALKEEAQIWAKRDLAIAEEMFDLGDAW